MDVLGFLQLPKKPFDKNDKRLIFYVTCCENKLFLTILNENNDELGSHDIDPIILFDNHPFRDNIKTVIFFLPKFEHPDYENKFRYRLMVAEKLKSQNIPFQFVTDQTYISMIPLVSANIHCKIDETVLTVIPRENHLGVTELLRTNDGYSIVNCRIIEFDKTSNNNKKDYGKIKAEIFGDCSTSKWIIVFEITKKFPEVMKILQKIILKSKKLIAIPCIQKMDHFKTISAIAKKKFDSSYNDFHVISQSEEAFFIFRGTTGIPKILVETEIGEKLPILKSAIVSKSFEKTYMAYFDKDLRKLSCISVAEPMEEKCHRIEVSIKIDENYLPYSFNEPLIIPKIEYMPKICDDSKGIDMPVIAFFDNSSVICIPGENGYEYLESWNGFFGYDIYLNFGQEKPRLITNVNDVKSDDTSIVYDLIKIMSKKSPEKIEIDKQWKFKVTKDSKHPILIQFDNFDGTRKASSPAFLLALILKEHIKAIKTKIGTKPHDLGFFIIDEYSMEEMNNIEDGIAEACKLLKMDFIFVELSFN